MLVALLLTLITVTPQIEEIPAWQGRQVDKQASIESGEKIVKTVTPAFTRVPPVIDGDITDRCYELVQANPAALAGGFVDPYGGDSLMSLMMDQTEVMVLRDNDALYFAAHCYDKNPKSIRRALLKRDDYYWLDDYLIVFLDTYHDRKSCYYFALNPRGTQFDGIISQEGETYNDNWDGIWQGAAKVDESGWTMEMRIPLRDLKFSHADGRWGINFYRMQRNDGQGSQWVPTGGNLYQVSNFGSMEGADAVPTTPTLDVLPYLAGGKAYRQAKFNASLFGEEKTVGPDWFDKEGIDLSSRILPSVSLTGTYHPDFAQVEADPDQINLTGEELFLKEKRPFFLEGQDLYSTPHQVFYSRRVGDIDMGGHTNGRFNRTTFDLIDVQASDTWSYLMGPGEQQNFHNFAIARLKQDFLTNSAVGITGINKHVEGKDMTAFSGDTKLDFFHGLAIADGQYTQARNENLDAEARSWLAQVYHSSDYLVAGAGYEYISDGFQQVLDTSYQPYGNLKGFWTEYKYYWYSPWTSLIRVSPYINIYQYHYVDGPYGMIPRQGFEFDTDFYFSGKWQLTTFYEDNQRIDSYLWVLRSSPLSSAIDYRWLERVSYHNRYLGARLSLNPFEYNSLEMGYEVGQHYNWNLNYGFASLTYKPLPPVSLTYTLDAQELYRLDQDMMLWINRLNLRYQLTKELYASSFVQFSDLSNLVTTNFLVGWHYRDGSDVYLAYYLDKIYRQEPKTVMNRVFLLKGTFWLGI